MAKKAKELTPLAVRNLTTPGLHFVGGVAGLALQVLPTGGRTWVLRATIGGRRRDMGLGGFPDVPLAEAREAARRARELIRSGVDPIEQAKTARLALKASAAKAMTFKAAAEAYIAAHEVSWKNAKHRQQWSNTLERYVYPVLGGLSVADVEVAHIHKVLEPIWMEKTETASRIRSRMELVLDWAGARGSRQGDNPARWRGHLDKLLPRRSKTARTVHHKALPAKDLPAFMARLRSVEGQGARAREFVILTCARSGEARGATWSEIDLVEKTWTVPAHRMKAGREHRVPLSAPAMRLLTALPRIAGSDLVFPSRKGTALSNMTLSAVLRRMDVDAVPHGFRSTFRDWAAESTAYPSEVAEKALAHAIASKTQAAYRRGDLLEKRRPLAEAWGRLCSETPVNQGQVVRIRG